MDLMISRLGGTSVAREWIERPYAKDSGYRHSWWTGSTKGPVEFFSFTTELHGEVARALTRSSSIVGDAYPTFDRPHHSLIELDLFEVRVDLHDDGFGRSAVNLLLEAFPGPYFGFSRIVETDGFWQRLGWVKHLHEDCPDHPSSSRATLFVAPG